MTNHKYESQLDQFEKYLSCLVEDPNEKDLSQGYTLISQLMQMEPQAYRLHEYLGRLNEIEGKYGEACNNLEKAIQLCGNVSDDITLGFYAHCLLMSNREQEAIPILEQLVERNEDFDHLKVMLACCYEAVGYLGRSLAMHKRVSDPELVAEFKPILDKIYEECPYYQSEANFNVFDKLINLVPTPILAPTINGSILEKTKDSSGRPCYVDKISKKLRPITPEEAVRQHTLNHLINILNIPSEYILVEESLMHMERDLNRRADILVRMKQQDSYRNLLVIECKEPNAMIIGDPIKQLLEYNHFLNCPYAMVTNGKMAHCFERDIETGNYRSIQEVPDFDALLAKRKIRTAEVQIPWTRPAWETLQIDSFIESQIERCEFIGPVTPKSLAPFILNLSFGLLDESKRLPENTGFGGVNFAHDYGVCNKRVSNASGGTYEGPYRWIKVFDRKGKPRFLYLGVFCTADGIGKSGKTTGGYSSLVVAVEHEGKPLSVFQLRLNEYARPTIAAPGLQLSSIGIEYQIVHSGARAGTPKHDVLDYVESHERNLFKEGLIDLGKLHDYENFTLEQPQFISFVARVASYSLLRYELFRQKKKRKRK